MNDDGLESLSDQQLNDKLAALLPGPERHCASNPTDVLTLLSRLSPDWSSRTYGGTTEVALHFVGPRPYGTFCGVAPTLARAGVVSAIRALSAELSRLAALSETGAICSRCKEPMRLNVPRLGTAGGYVHVATGGPQCGAFQTLAYGGGK